MPVKFVHLFFIVAAFLLTMGLAVWAWDLHQRGGEPFLLVYSAGSAVSGVVLFGYVLYFWRKMKGIK